MKVSEKSFRVDRAICPHCGVKTHKVIENKSLFDGSLTFHIIKLRCGKCNREYLDLEQAQVYDLFLVFNKLKERSLHNVVERVSHQVTLKR